ncbi:hypothetical protein MMC07_002400 [Pseudocyphellaria aurata]|nr:hypothetical protein [Pseudocyphellaria aurata]
MTHKELPAPASNIVLAVGSLTTCTPAIVDCLRSLLISAEASPLRPEHAPVNSERPKTKGSRARAVGGPSSKSRRRPVTILETCQEEKISSQLQEKSRLATEVVNITLKALTEAIKNPTQRRIDQRNPVAKSIPCTTNPNALGEGPPEPLRSICVNSVSSLLEARSPLRRSSSNMPPTYLQGLRSQAECARIAFLALRSLSTRKVAGTDVKYLQLESGMSALIGKMITLGFDDLAVKELQVLKRRLDQSIGTLSTDEDFEPSTLLRPASSKRTSTKRVALADLLQFQNTAASGPLLALIIASQLQALKIIVSKPDPYEIEAVVEYIQLVAPTSPANLIQRQLDTSSESRTKVARQLEMLAQTMLSLSSYTVASQKTQKPESDGKKLSAHAIFKIQTLVLEIRSRSWKICDRQIDFPKEMCHLFARHLSSLHQSPPLANIEKYELAKSAFQSVFACTEHQTLLNSITVGLRKHPIHTVYQVLADLAQDCCSYVEAAKWLQRSSKLLDASAVSRTALCATLCRIANLRLRAFSKDTESEGLLTSMKDAIECLEGDIRGDSVDLDDLLQVVLTLRRLAFSILQSHQKSPEKSKLTEFSKILDHCSQLIILGVKFLVRYVGGGSGSDKDAKAVLRHAQRKITVWNNASPFFGSIAAMVRFSTADSMQDWTRLESGLQECLRLVSVLTNIEVQRTAESNHEDLKELSLVQLSHAYWYRYQYLKQTVGPQQEIRRSLRLSIEILKNRSFAEKLAGLLPTKLEKYGAIYEASKDHVKAADTYTEALRLHVDGGHLRLAAEAAATRPLVEIFGENGCQSVLGRLLFAYSRVILGMDRQTSGAKLLFDDVNLVPSERGLLLEQQLTYIVSAPHVPQSSILAELVQSLAISIFAIYTDSEFPVRRLRVGLQLLRIHFTHPSAVEPNIIEQILCNKRSPLNLDYPSCDRGLHSFGAHLLNCRVLYASLAHADLDMEAVERSLASWSSMLQKCSGFNSLQCQVDDISDWKLQLESFAQYLDMQSLGLLRVSILHLLVSVQEMGVNVEPSAIVSVYSDLGLQYIRLGYSNQAGHTLHKASKYLLGFEISGPVLVKWNLASAEYALGLGNVMKAEEHLANAHEIYKRSAKAENTHILPLRDRSRLAQLLADATYVHSLTATAHGNLFDALIFARQNVKLNYQAWSILEHRHAAPVTSTHPDTSESDDTSVVNQMSTLSLANSPVLLAQANPRVAIFWSIVPRLFQSLIHLSQLFAHEGLLPEAQYYVEQSRKIADAVQAVRLRGQALALLGTYLTHKGEVEQGIDLLRQAEKANLGLQNDQYMALLYMYMAENYSLRRETDSEAGTSDAAGKILEHLMKASFIEGINCQSTSEQSLEVAIDQLHLSEGPPTRRPRTQRRIPNKPLASTTSVKTTLSISARETKTMADTPLLSRLKCRSLRQRAHAAIRGNKLDMATSLLSEAMEVVSIPQDRILLEMVKGHLFFRKAQEKMIADPIFCVLPESTISHPSLRKRQETAMQERSSKEKQSASPPKKVTAKGSLRKPKQAHMLHTSDILELLNLTQENLVSVSNMAKKMCSTATIHTMTDVLTKTLMTLSAITLSQPKTTTNPSFVVYAIELGRTASSIRESLAVRAERESFSRQKLLDWPRGDCTEDKKSSCIDGHLDFSSFQAQYIDIIPRSWTVISISLSESQDEIRIARICSDQSPFILSLPLNRHNSRDPDEEVFGFENGKDALLEIVGLANYSAHASQDMAREGAKSEWWQVREALDTRLKDLLFNVEKIWLGGFRGIFSDCTQSPQLLSRFQQSFQNILDKHLPSRQKLDRKKRPSPAVLDSRVLELFISLGVPTELDDLDEPLIDLLYFVIDVLQFHGERNAYDEIDFDSIVIEVIDALRQYHEAAKSEAQTICNNHIILVLDKALHSFPWESLPCLNKRAVSRLPSLACLRDRILRHDLSRQQNGSLSNHGGLHVHRNKGASILNPAGDLKATQAKFEQPLQNLSGWITITQREPTEDEMKSCLESSEIFLYFGHGSGSQYIRARTLRKLERCAVAVLMGCSSGALTEAGEFEPYGTPKNYMQAACPAVLANLWDVTDGDIDRFSDHVLQKWGVLDDASGQLPSSPVKRCRKNKAKATAESVETMDIGRVSLDEAVAQGRSACRLRYLNGAAPVIYGVPVFIS